MHDSARARRHHDQVRGQEQRLLDAVRDEKHSCRCGARRRVSVPVRFAGERVERAQRLVHQHQRGSLASARAMPTRCCMPPELLDRPLGQPSSPTSPSFSWASCRVGGADAAHAQPEFDVLATSSHGISACFWNTTPRSAPGPSPACRRLDRSLGRRQNPAMHDRSVVLPQPERRWHQEFAVAHREVDA